MQGFAWVNASGGRCARERRGRGIGMVGHMILGSQLWLRDVIAFTSNMRFRFEPSGRCFGQTKLWKDNIGAVGKHLNYL